MTPCQIKQPCERDDERRNADLGHDRALDAADERAQAHRDRDRDDSGIRMAATRKLELGDGQGRYPAQISDRKVDLAEQEDEDHSEGEHGQAGHLDDDVVEVVRGEEVRRLEAEEDDDERQADDDRQDPEVARPHVVVRPGARALPAPRLRPFRGDRSPVPRRRLPSSRRQLRRCRRDARDLRGNPCGDRLHDLLLGGLLPLVDTPTSRPRRSTVMRVATSKTSCRLCEMRTTARPCSARRLTRSSTWRVCATPSAAVGSSRMTSFEFHMHGLRDRDRLPLAAGQRGDRLTDRADRRDGRAT